MTALSLPRPRRVRPVAILGASLVLIAASQAANLLAPRASVPAPQAAGQVVTGPVAPAGAPIADAPGSLEIIDHSIGLWTANVAKNERDFISAANLGALYEARARLSGDVSDYSRAITAAERSLGIEQRQLDVQALHARLQLATHDFGRALTEAQAIDRAVPNQPAVLSIIADASLELGDVDGASRLYDQIQRLTPGPAVTARLARLSFLRGDISSAVTMAEAAYDAANAEGTAGPALSWYAYLAGTMQLNAGAPDAAGTWFATALEAWPTSYLALAGDARAAAARGDDEAAIDGYRAAIAVAPQPDALTALGDLLSLGGDAKGAEAQYGTVLAIAQLQGSAGLIFNRQLVLFDVNHARDLAAALTLAEHELDQRKDVYGYDTYAWALLANGRATDADAAMTRAMALGTRDALLLYHAGEIKLALGDSAAARSLLGDALAINGALDPLAASRAASSLASIR
jgi:tetratricopeptide (TPR) repeat protein